MKKFAIMLVALLSLAACDHMSRQQQRALSGGAIGSAGGLAISAMTGGNLLTGAAIGGAGGAAVGALTTK
jgi:hypothetical protein